MRKFAFYFLFLFSLWGSSETIKAPELTPALTNQHEQAIIDEGIALHNQGKYEEAIAKYKQVLEKSPGNVLAMYEMAFSFFAAEKYDDALKTADEGARYKSRYLGKFYMLIGNSLDGLGKNDEAISAFRQALEVVNDDGMIHFNLAVTLVNTGKPNEARPHLKKSVQLNPTHITSHYALARVYFDQGYRIPGILSMLRFLSLEPKTQRSSKAIALLDENIEKGVESKSSQKVEVTVNSDSPTDEGEFKGLELMISLITAGKYVKDKKEKTIMEQRIELLNDLFKAMGEEKGKGNFVVENYFPYFVDLQKNDLVATFTYYIYQSTNREAAAWIEQHENEIQAYVKWSNDFVSP